VSGPVLAREESEPAAPPAAPRPARANRVRGVVMAWFLLGGILGSGLVGPNRPSIEREYGIAHLHFGLALAAMQIVSSAAVLLASPRLARWNPCLLVLGGLVLWTLGFFTVAFTSGGFAILAGWSGVVMGVVLGSVLNNVGMALWPADLRRGINLIHTSNGLGKVIGPALAAACLPLHWRWSFGVAGLLSLAIGAAFFVERRSLTSLAAPAARRPAGGRTVLRRPFFWLCVLPFGMIAGGEAAFSSLLPAYLQEVRHLTPALAAILLSVHLSGLVAGRFSSAHLSGRFTPNATIGGCLAAGLAIVPFLAVSGWAASVASLFVLGFLFSSTWPTFYAQVSMALRDHPEMLAYGSTLGSYLGIALAVLASSMIADRNLTLSLLFGPALVWGFGLLYFTTPLSDPRP
jgi:predicted MFS family arabinose efflux permease